MGAIDLVVQIEAPPSVASGLQRIGRGGHQVDAVSEGVIFPEVPRRPRGVRRRREGDARRARSRRRGIRAIRSTSSRSRSSRWRRWTTWDVDELFATIRRAAPFAELSRTVFDGVLDMLSGRYPSDEFAELRPRVTWDRVAGTVVAREGAKRVAIANGGTIPDRGLFGVFLVGRRTGRRARRRARRGDGVREPRRRDLRARRLVVAHRGDHARPRAGLAGARRAGQDAVLEGRSRRPAARARAGHRPADARPAARCRRPPPSIGSRASTISTRAPPRTCSSTCAIRWPRRGAVPDAATIVVERVRDELGDWRVCVLSPRGGRIHAPWAMAAAAKIREETGIDVETLWGDDGFVVRFPDVDQPPDPRLLLPDPDEVQALVVRQLGATALFAAKFRENAARSLLLPKRRPGMRAPLWQQRKRAADLLAVASRYGSFPVLLETYRECLRDFFDMPALVATLADVRSRKIRVVDRRLRDGRRRLRRRCSSATSPASSTTATRRSPSGARRRSSVDQAQLRELLGDAELRELLDADAMDAVERQLQRLDPQYRARSADGVHDMLLGARRSDATTRSRARSLTRRRRGERRRRSIARAARPSACGSPASARYIAVEDAARYRDALGVPLPPGIPESLLAAGARSARRSRAALRAHARAVHGGRLRGALRPDAAAAEAVLVRLTREGRLLEGEFRPGGTRREWTDAGVLRMLRRRSLAKLRHEVEPVDQAVLGRFVDDVAGHRATAARRRRAARRHRAAAGRAAAGLDPRDRHPAGAPRRATTRPISTPSSPPAKSSGSASSRSASATAGSRCISPITSPRLLPPRSG